MAQPVGRHHHDGQHRHPHHPHQHHPHTPHAHHRGIHALGQGAGQGQNGIDNGMQGNPFQQLFAGNGGGQNGLFQQLLANNGGNNNLFNKMS